MWTLNAPATKKHALPPRAHVPYVEVCFTKRVWGGLKLGDSPSGAAGAPTAILGRHRAHLSFRFGAAPVARGTGLAG